MSAVTRGLRNPFRSRARAGAVVMLLAIILGAFAVLVQGSLSTRQQIETLQANVRTVVELREAGAFGTGGFGGDKPVGADDFSMTTLAQVRQIPTARHIAKIEEYIHAPQVDPTRTNAYAMIIGLRPGAPLRAIGEVDYENARIVAGRGFAPEDQDADVAIVGRVYAQERLGGAPGEGLAAQVGKTLTLEGQPVTVIGIYATGNDFGDNHAFVPLTTFRRLFHPGNRLSKIRVTVDSVANVEAVAADLKRLKGVDAVTAAEQVATAKATLGSIAAASLYGSALLFAIGSVLVVFVMVLATRERVREIGTLKAIGASNGEIVTQFVAEVGALMALATMGAVIVAALFGIALQAALGIDVRLDRDTLLLIALGGFAFAVIGSAYPILTGLRLSPVQAMKSG